MDKPIMQKWMNINSVTEENNYHLSWQEQKKKLVEWIGQIESQEKKEEKHVPLVHQVSTGLHRSSTVCTRLTWWSTVSDESD